MTTRKDCGAVLIVDDEVDTRNLLSEILSETGYSTAAAEDGLDAAKHLMKDRFDVAVLDLKMPGMDGIQLLQMIKNIHPATSVIITTGFASVETASDAVRRGADDYLLKPIGLGELKTAVERGVAKSRAAIREAQERERLRESEKRLAGEKARLEARVEDIKKRVSILDSKLDRHAEQIAHMCEMGTLITSILDLEQIFVVLMEIGINMVEGEVGSIMLAEGGPLKTKIAWGLEETVVWSFKLKDGTPIVEHVLKTGEGLLIADMESDSAAPDKQTHVAAQSLLSVPLRSRDNTVGVMTVANKADGGQFTEADRSMLSAAASFAGVAYENAKLHAESLERERMAHELKMARDIQMNLLPLQPPVIPGVELAGRCVPARQVGGDLFDFIELGDDQCGVALGDVSGKGTPAALIMATSRTIIRSEARRLTEPSETLKCANDLLCMDVGRERGMFVTLVYLVYDARKKAIKFGNAGHCPPLLWRESSQTLERLMPGGPLMGFQGGLDYEQEVLQLGRGDLLFLYTDGFTEAEDPAGKPFGDARLRDLVVKHHHLPVEEFLDVLYKELQAYEGEGIQHDDMTGVVLRVT